MGVAIIVADILSITKRGKLTLSADKLQIYMYLAKNPIVLNRVLRFHGLETISLKNEDSFSFYSLSANVDSLFDRKLTKIILNTLLEKEMISTLYKNKDNFYFKLTDYGENIARELNSPYFHEIRYITDRMKVLQSHSEAQLNTAIYQSIKQRT